MSQDHYLSVNHRSIFVFQTPSPEKLTHEYLISQASTSTVSATQQLLTLTLAAISDTAKLYR